jgi:hypothetical protein
MIPPYQLCLGLVLEAPWGRLALYVKGTEITCLRFHVEAGQKLGIGITNESHSWRIGDTVETSGQDCQYICLSLILFCGRVGEELNKGLVAPAGLLSSQQ